MARSRRTVLLVIAALAVLTNGGGSAVGGAARRVTGHIPAARVAASTDLGRHSAAAPMALSVSLTLRDAAGLAELITALHDPADPRYGQYITPDEFRARYAPTDADVALVTNYLASRGLTVKGVSGSNLIVNVEGTTSAVENAFQVEMHDYFTPDGLRVFAPNSEPLVLGDAADHVLAVNGLSSFGVRHTHKRQLAKLDDRAVSGKASLGAYMTPAKVKTAYGLSSLTQTGSGETLALFELDGYTASDLSTYASQFGLAVPTLQNIYVGDGSTTPTGTAGSNTDEVTLDIELAMSVAPGLAKILVYEGANSDQGVLNTYARIANDNLAKEVSTSWGSAEDTNTSSYMNSENTVFQQMAAQGQSMFAAAGDSGAYDDSNNPTTLAVDDPGSQPFVTCVGGTSLQANATTGAYVSETPWADKTTSPASGGGGGISSVWSIPSWQSGLGNTTNKGSSSMRMVPDVSLDADPNTGYPIYVTYPGQAGAWYAFGGTSAAAPSWAAFAAIVNQGRVAAGSARLGFANPSLYQVGKSSLYANAFHDINSGTNLYYPGTTGFDLASGWGTFKAPGLYSALETGSLPPTAPTSLTLTSSATSLTLSWSGATNATSYNVYRSATATGTYTQLATGVTATTYTDTTAAGVNYYYVIAVNSSGSSSASPVQSGAIDQSAPGTPTGLTGTVN